ncbi:MAG TPA: hypothetical protein VFC19_42040 [Candidatus Limnocylindrales bacterium]|nr:hypothetical protein [Candidatus Limnocylindrales bacterium]
MRDRRYRREVTSRWGKRTAGQLTDLIAAVLFHDQQPADVAAPAGVSATTVRRWLYRVIDRLAGRARAWTADQITRHVAATLLDPVRFAQWESLPEVARTEQIAAQLRATRHLLVLDNAESITATPAAIPHALPEAEQKRLADLLARLHGGQTLVLVGSREDERRLAPSAFGDNIYRLPGLDPQAASVLLERILHRHGADHYLSVDTDPVQRHALSELTTVLGGFPLPMTVVLPQPASHTPQQVLADCKPEANTPTRSVWSAARSNTATANSTPSSANPSGCWPRSPPTDAGSVARRTRRQHFRPPELRRLRRSASPKWSTHRAGMYRPMIVFRSTPEMMVLKGQTRELF